MNKRYVIEMQIGKRYGASRLNCDESGQQKDLVINGSRFNRISSQSKKKPVKDSLMKSLVDSYDENERIYNTRGIKKILEKKFIETENPLFQESANEIASFVAEEVMGCKFKDDAPDITKQILVFTEYDLKDIVEAFCSTVSSENWDVFQRELSALAEYKEAVAKNKSKKNQKDGPKKPDSDIGKAMKTKLKKMSGIRLTGIICALFGRMSTVDVIPSVESAVCVNHSFSFGRANTDADYFIACDNYLSEVESESGTQNGAAYLDDKDFSSHVYYEYVSIDVEQFYKNLCRGLDMKEERNQNKVRCIVKEVIMFVVNAFAVSAPSGGQNAFASVPNPVGVYLSVRESGFNRSADSACMQEMFSNDKDSYKKTEEDKFINAMKTFVSNDFTDSQTYLAQIYVGEGADKICNDSIKHMTWNEAVSTIGEMVNERF